MKNVNIAVEFSFILRRIKEKRYSDNRWVLNIYYNYMRECMALDELILAEVDGIKVEGKNKWITLIQILVLRTLNS